MKYIEMPLGLNNKILDAVPAMQYRYGTCGSILGLVRASILGPLCAPIWGRLCPMLRRSQDYKIVRTKETMKTQGALRSFSDCFGVALAKTGVSSRCRNV